MGGSISYEDSLRASSLLAGGGVGSKKGKKTNKKRAVSLFSGAGGMGVGVERRGFDTIFANDINEDACQTHRQNVGKIKSGDIRSHFEELASLKDVDLIYGGPSCQGFSTAGRQDRNDPRSKHVWTYLEVVRMVRPRCLLIENVVGMLNTRKFAGLMPAILNYLRELGYIAGYTVVNSSEHGTPQKRRRVIIAGFLSKNRSIGLVPDLESMLAPYKSSAKSVKEVLSVLDNVRDDTGNNPLWSKAKIIPAPHPSFGRGVFSSLLFGGFGRFLRLSGWSPTILSYSGNALPIIDELEFGDTTGRTNNWGTLYYDYLMGGGIPGSWKVPSYIRRISVKEAQLLQTFPVDFEFFGTMTSQYAQIGNAVPCEMAYNLACMMMDYLDSGKIIVVNK